MVSDVGNLRICRECNRAFYVFLYEKSIKLRSYGRCRCCYRK